MKNFNLKNKLGGITQVFVLTLGLMLWLPASQLQAQDSNLSKKEKEEYQKRAKAQTANLDSTIVLSDSLKQVVYNLNYNYWASTHEDRMKEDSLRKELMILRQRTRAAESDRNKQLRNIAGKDQREGFKKYRMLDKTYMEQFNSPSRKQ